MFVLFNTLWVKFSFYFGGAVKINSDYNLTFVYCINLMEFGDLLIYFPFFIFFFEKKFF